MVEMKVTLCLPSLSKAINSGPLQFRVTALSCFDIQNPHSSWRAAYSTLRDHKPCAEVVMTDSEGRESEH